MYEHLQFQKFLGSLALAIKGKKQEGKRGRGREGRGGKGKGKPKGQDQREGGDRLAPKHKNLTPPMRKSLASPQQIHYSIDS
jgi:hypothetical protein